MKKVTLTENKQAQPSFGLSPELLEKHAKKAFDEGIKHASFDLLNQADAFKKGAKLRRQIRDDGNPYKNHLSVYKVIDEFENNIYAKAS